MLKADLGELSSVSSRASQARVASILFVKQPEYYHTEMKQPIGNTQRQLRSNDSSENDVDGLKEVDLLLRIYSCHVTDRVQDSAVV